MKKILIISYFFPPATFTGSFRIYSWAKYLNQFGYYPIIITRNWDIPIKSFQDMSSTTSKEVIHEKFENYEVYYLPYIGNFRDKLYEKYGDTKMVLPRRILTFLELLFQNFTTRFVPFRNLYTFSHTYLKKNKDINCLIASGRPYVLFNFCYKLSKKFKIPWIADYRDDWNTSQWLLNKRLHHKLIVSLEKKSEKKWLSNASCFVSISPYYVNAISNFINRPGYVVMNGFDPSDYTSVNQNQKNKVFTILFNGTLYDTQPAEIFTEAYKLLIDTLKEKIQIKLVFIGLNFEKNQAERIRRLLKGYEQFYEITDRYERKIALDIMASVDVFLMFSHANAKGVTSSKIFDYLAFGKPVILCPSDNEILEEIITSTQSGYICNSKEDAFEILKKLYLEFSSSEITSGIKNRAIIQKFSRENQTKRLSEIIDSITINNYSALAQQSDNTKCKKVLILAYDFPPYVSVGGLRPYSWYSYFKEYGIFPVIVTRQWSNKYGNQLDYIAPGDSDQSIIEKAEQGIVIRTPYNPNFSNRLLLKYQGSRYKFFRKFISAYYEFAQFLFLIGPKSRLYFAAKDFLKNNKVDVIIATGEPFILFRYASLLSKKNNIPWIADYRDPWAQDKKRSGNYIKKIWNSFFEKKYLKNVSAVTTVSSFFVKQISKLIANKPFHIIPNGYNPDAINDRSNTKQADSTFSIAYIGTIYKWHPIDSFLSVCNDLVSKNTTIDFQINFYGVNKEIEINELVQSNFKNLVPKVTFFPKTQNEELLQKLASENVLLLFNDYSILGTKIYDYLLLKRKIILCYSDDKEANKLKNKYFTLDIIESEAPNAQKDIINVTNSGIVVKDANHLIKVLNDLFLEFKTKGFIECNSSNIEQFSRKIQVQKLAEIIHNIKQNRK